jgi:sensor histidine kinase YesM
MRNRQKHRKYRSIRTRLLLLCGIVILVMLALCCAILVQEQLKITSLLDSLHSFDIYNQYTTALARVQRAMRAYSDGFEPTQGDHCLELISQLSDVSEAMGAQFPNSASFLSNAEITSEYIQASLALLADGDAAPDELLSSYEQTELIRLRIVENSSSLVNEYILNISRPTVESLGSWSTQFQAAVLAMIWTAVILLAIANRYIKHILRPVQLLAEQSRSVAEGSLPVRFIPLEMTENNEISQLSNTYVQMANTINNQMSQLMDKLSISKKLRILEEKNMSMQLLLTQKELSLMQSMINPHFLFNALSTISGAALLESAPRTHMLAITIARFLRESLNRVGTQVTLHEELKHLDQYLYIQSLRFGERVQCKVFLDPQCARLRVPALFLQPLVENSFSHGLKHCTQGGTIDVRAEADETGATVITVRDNGCGIPPEQLEELNNGIDNAFRSGANRIGLRSVASQLRSVLSESIVFALESEIGQWTRVTITIPPMAAG